MSEFRRRLLMQSKNDNPILDNYLTIVALEDGLTAKLSVNACEYCVDGDGNWKTLPADTETESINAGQTLSFRGNLIPTNENGIGTFTVNKYYNLKGTLVINVKEEGLEMIIIKLLEKYTLCLPLHYSSWHSESCLSCSSNGRHCRKSGMALGQNTTPIRYSR